MYVSEQATPCFQWFTGFKNEQTRKLIRVNLSFSILMKREELMEPFAAYRTIFPVS